MKKLLALSLFVCLIGHHVQTLTMFSGWFGWGEKKTESGGLPANIQKDLKKLAEEFTELQDSVANVAQGKYASIAELHIANIQKLINSKSTLFTYAKAADKASKQLLAQELEKIDRQYKEIFQKVTQLSQLKMSTIADLTEYYKSNFEPVLKEIPEFNPKSVYELLGFETISKGQKASLSDVIQALKAQKEMLSDTLYRQIEYIFANEFSKKMYDAYLSQDAAALGELQNNLNEAIIAQLQGEMMMLGPDLADLKGKTKTEAVKEISVTTTKKSKNGGSKK
jgi:hypothetical protein